MTKREVQVIQICKLLGHVWIVIWGSHFLWT